MPKITELLDIKVIREELGLSQSELAARLGVSPRTIQACEQGWRNPSDSLEKSILILLMARRHGKFFGSVNCWEIVDCSPDIREQCLAYQSGQGHLCWFVTGHLCKAKRLEDWSHKKTICDECEFFQALLHGETPSLENDE